MTADSTPEEAQHLFDVDDSDVGKRLDAFLSIRFPEVSRVRIQRGIADGLAKVDGQNRKSSYKLRPEQSVEFQLPPPPAEGPQPEPIPLDLLYEDEILAVVNKPAGMIVHPGQRPLVGHAGQCLGASLSRA